MKTPKAVIGLDLGGTKLASAIFTKDGKILHREATPLGKRGGKAVGKLIGEQVQKLLKIGRAKGFKMEAIGVCVPGIAHPDTGRVWAPNIRGWEDYPLREEILAGPGARKLRVVVDSDRAACILGEAWQGAAKGCRNAVFLAVGTGIGAGILAEGKVLRGANGIAGAIGWWALQKPHQPPYVSCGCFEHHASGHGLAKIAKEILAQEKQYSGALNNKRSITAHDVFENFANDDSISVRALNQAIEFWGMAVANLVSLFDPEKIIFGGGVFGPGAQFLPEIYAEAWKWAQPISIQHVRVEVSKLGTDAGLFGAGFLAWKK